MHSTVLSVMWLPKKYERSPLSLLRTIPRSQREVFSLPVLMIPDAPHVYGVKLGEWVRLEGAFRTGASGLPTLSSLCYPLCAC